MGPLEVSCLILQGSGGVFQEIQRSVSLDKMTDLDGGLYGITFLLSLLKLCLPKALLQEFPNSELAVLFGSTLTIQLQKENLWWSFYRLPVDNSMTKLPSSLCLCDASHMSQKPNSEKVPYVDQFTSVLSRLKLCGKDCEELLLCQHIYFCWHRTTFALCEWSNSVSSNSHKSRIGLLWHTWGFRHLYPLFFVPFFLYIKCIVVNGICMQTVPVSLPLRHLGNLVI